MIVAAVSVSAASADGAAAGPFSLTANPGGCDEHCLRLKVGETLDCDFVADGSIDFNLRYHRDREIVSPVRQLDLRTVERTRIVATATDDDCLM